MDIDLKRDKEIDDDTLQESKKTKKNNMYHNSKMLCHDCTISGRTYSNVTNNLDRVNCRACLNVIMNNKLIRERYIGTILGESRILSSEENSRQIFMIPG